jgi:hypothetical protein
VCVYVGGRGTAALGSESIATSPGRNRSRVERPAERARAHWVGRAQRLADNGQTCAVGCCAADVECSICAAEAVAAACPTAQSAASCACVPWQSVHKIGREGAAAVASRLVGLVGLVDVLWRGSRQSPSRRPEQRYQLQGPVRVHLCGGGVIKATDGGGNGARAASGAWETGAPASLLESLSPCRALPFLLTLWPFVNRPLITGN